MRSRMPKLVHMHNDKCVRMHNDKLEQMHRGKMASIQGKHAKKNG
jgi:hypothetical protein